MIPPAPCYLVTLLRPAVLSSGPEDRSRGTCGEESTIGSVPSLARPGRLIRRARAWRRCTAHHAGLHCAARCTRKRGNVVQSSDAQQRTPFHGLLFSTLPRPMDSVWKTTCRNLRSLRGANSARPAPDALPPRVCAFYFSFSLSLPPCPSCSRSPFIFLRRRRPARILFRDR